VKLLAGFGWILTFAYALWLRPRMLRWGATGAEVQGAYPGANLVPEGVRDAATMAVTIDAPPEDVWPWLVQMGCDRAGWYSWDRLDNGGVPSAERVHPEWQKISAGDRLASIPSGRAWFEVAALEPERFLALRAPLDLRGRPFDTSGAPPRFFTDSVWCFQLRPLPGGQTRLVVSGYSAARPQFLKKLLDLLFWQPAHWVMQTRQFAGLKERAEQRASRATADSHRMCTESPASRLGDAGRDTGLSKTAT
jgi:proline iminopeptidase